MTELEYTLDDIAESVLPQDQAWEASMALGTLIAQHMATDGVEGHNRYYWLDNTQGTLCGVSEQPDLDREVEVVLHRGEGTWNMLRPRTDHEIPTIPQRAGQYIGFHVGDVATADTLLQVVLPLTKITSRLLQRGAVTSFSFTPPQQDIMRRYDAGELMLNPRRVQVAAQIMSRIVTEQVVGRPSCFKTDEAEETFMDTHFPYQDVQLAGGGGRTVRRRVARPR